MADSGHLGRFLDMGRWSVDIPAADGGFRPRSAWVYLPPAWFGADRGSLPVVELLHGAPGSPWQVQYTNRSGLGITADRCLIYVSGSNLTTESLARALADAGSVRAMELDIHASNPTFNFFSPAPGTNAQVNGAKLIPAMKSPSDRYLAPDQRDFFAVTIPG